MANLIVIPEYIRQAKLSNKQRLDYFVFDGKDIKSKFKNKSLFKRFIDKNKESQIALNYGKITPICLKSKYEIGCFNNKKYLCNILDLRNYDDYGYGINFYKSFEDFYYGELLDKRFIKGNKSDNIEFILCDKKSKEIISANPTQVGKPKMITINGQAIYSGNMAKFVKGEVIRQIKESFVPYVENMIPFKEEDYPLRVRYYLFDTEENQVSRNNTTEWDVGNRMYPYVKALLDLLSTGCSTPDTKHFEPKIIDDNQSRVREDGGITFFPVNNVTESKIVVLITTAKDDYYKILKQFELTGTI